MGEWMTRTEQGQTMTRETTDQSNGRTTERCPMCDEPLADSPYPRHRLVLEDESEVARNQRHEQRVCQACWDDLRRAIASA